MAYKWGVILTTYDTWEPILQVIDSFGVHVFGGVLRIRADYL